MTPPPKPPTDVAAILERLKDARGKTYWRCLEELAECEGFEKLLQQRFDTRLPTLSNPVSRRRFLMVMAASLGLAGLGGCNPQRPQEEIVPYVRQPEELVPGIPMFFATAMPLSGFAIGQLLESHEGRPTKVEGNELHPASLGASDPYAQASILTLYNPNRASTITYLDRVQSSDAFTGAMQAMLQQHRKTRGRGLRVLTESLSSPTFGRQMAALQEILPEMKWHVYEPAGNDTARQGSLLAFGRDVHTLYRFAEAQVVLSLDADFFASGPAHIRYACDFMARRQAALRKPGEKGPEMNRLYMVEAMFTPTGVKADHRWAMRAGEVETFARAVAAGVDEKLRDALGQVQPVIPEPALKALVRDLAAHRGQSIVIPGREQPATVHALAHAMNHALGNVGKTVIHTEPIELRPVNQTESLRELIGAMAGGEVETLLILGGNPAYSAPADLDFTKAMLAQDAQGRDLIPLRVHLSLFRNETSRLCHWFLPETHYLESWSDARAFDGTASIIQPLIAPLYGGQSAHDLLASLVPSGGRTGYEAVRATWRASWEQRKIGDNFEAFWREAVHNGVVEGTAAKPIEVSLQEGWTKALAPSRKKDEVSGLELIFRPDPTVYDGRFAENAWLQELPKPLTALTWGNAAILSPATAAKLGISSHPGWHGGGRGEVLTDVVQLRYRGRDLRIPAWILAGHADDAVTVHLGYGRREAGNVGTAIGANAYLLRTSDEPWNGRGLEIRKLDEQVAVACVQFHNMIDSHDPIRAGTWQQYASDPSSILKAEEGHHGELPSMYPEFAYDGYRWAMGINLTTCIGCNACVVACQSENNIPVVGREEVLRAREMHWLRIDHYFEGSPVAGDLRAFFQPVPCMHCEKAPCEVVCPTEATVHSADGLNDMIYNRCVGTRYCSNNCPYKVRRFNFFQYANWNTESLKLLYNPDVTVRSRGVMEKCTYCVQRIREAEIRARRQDRRVRDGEVMTACQAACPTQAIVFGDLNDPTALVTQWKAMPIDYGLLAELNTQPRTTYLAAIRNPNPEIETS
jgi:molybdopterin-containing oxidoreductase family iron-sulfur binding subunit